jgi:hypothetical protein
VNAPDHRASANRTFDVGVAILPLGASVPAPRTESGQAADSAIPGYDEVLGRGRLHSAEKAPFLIEKGEEAVRAATEAIAIQIGLATHRMATAIGEQLASPPAVGACDLESVSVCFGVTLAAGIQAMFTAQAESSVQVSITLRPRHAAGDPDVS